MPQNSSESEQAKIIWNETPSVRIANDFWHAQSSFLKYIRYVMEIPSKDICAQVYFPQEHYL